MSIQVCLLSRMKIDYTESGGKKAFPANMKHQYHVSQCGELDCCINNKKNGDYHVHPHLSHFTDELWLYGIWWKGSFSCKSKASISSIYMWRTRLSCQKQKEWRLLGVSKFVSFHGRTLFTRKMVERIAFLVIRSINTVYPDEVNMIVVPNNEKNGDY